MWWTLAGMGLLVMGGVLFWRLGLDFRADAQSVHACVDRKGIEHVDKRQGGYVWTRDFVCASRTEAPLYLDAESTEKIATLDTAKSWFVCWRLGRVQDDGERVWYYTLGDRAEPGKSHLGGWGYVGAENVIAPTHPIQNMPPCGDMR
ncbi:hypothetical protein [Streptosporangium sp. NPDC049304]